MKIFLILLTVAMLFSTTISMEAAVNQNPAPVTLEYYGHSCILLTLENGAKILIDPYDPTRMPYSLPAGPVDVVLSSHDHFDHGAIAAISSSLALKADGRQPTFTKYHGAATLRKDGSLAVNLRGDSLICSTIPSFHDNRKGQQRGVNGILRLEIDGLTFVHLGDLGDTLSADQIARSKPVDVLMIPVGGFYTIDAAQAKKVAAQLSPRVIIPIHYKTAVLPEQKFPISGVDPFLEGYPDVKREIGSTITFKAGSLPDHTTIEVLKYHDQK